MEICWVLKKTIHILHFLVLSKHCPGIRITIVDLVSVFSKRNLIHFQNSKNWEISQKYGFLFFSQNLECSQYKQHLTMHCNCYMNEGMSSTVHSILHYSFLKTQNNLLWAFIADNCEHWMRLKGKSQLCWFFLSFAISNLLVKQSSYSLRFTVFSHTWLNGCLTVTCSLYQGCKCNYNSSDFFMKMHECPLFSN